MAKRVTINIQLVMTGYDDQVEFIKETLVNDLQQCMDQWEFDIEDVPDDQVDDFCQEMKDLEG